MIEPVHPTNCVDGSRENHCVNPHAVTIVTIGGTPGGVKTDLPAAMNARDQNVRQSAIPQNPQSRTSAGGKPGR